MSRLATMSPAALKAMFAPESDDTLIALITLTGPGVVSPIRLADNYTQRLSETADEVTYGVFSRGQPHIFLPFTFTLPTEEHGAEPRWRITVHDVTRHLTPLIRSTSEALDCNLELVLYSTPDVVEASFPSFLLGGIGYNENTVAADLTVESQAVEPFPAHGFTPSYFPGLF